MKKILLILMCFMFPSVSLALTPIQVSNLKTAYYEGYEINYPETIQCIIFQESSGGIQKVGDEGTSLGAGQFQIPTAQMILKKHNINLTNEQIKVKLLNNDGFSIWLTAKYFDYLMKQFEGETNQWSKSVISYNYGIGRLRREGFENYKGHYLKNIRKRLKTEIRPFNRKFNMEK